MDGPREDKGNTDSSQSGADDANENAIGSKPYPKIGHKMRQYHCGAEETGAYFQQEANKWAEMSI